MFGVQFYPTPDWLIDKMLSLVKWDKVKYGLEPSAGRGDIAMKMRKHCMVDCVEIDQNLRQILVSKGLFVVGEDFLRTELFTRYDLVAMNPPFKDGDKHLLKALDMIRSGGQVVCLLNENTLENSYSKSRKTLLDTLKEMNAHIEWIGNAFSDSEHKTDVSVVLIYVNVSKTEDVGLSFDELKEAIELTDDGSECTDIICTDEILAMVQMYRVEAATGLKVIESFEKFSRYIPAIKESEYGGYTPLIRLSVVSREAEKSGTNIGNKNWFLRELRAKYWEQVFGSQEMRSLMTMEVRDNYMAKLNEFRRYDFTLRNIRQVQLDLSKSLSSNIESAIMRMFDKLTYQHSLHKNNNVHYYNGWKTNDCCKVKQKVIVPFYGLYDTRFNSWSTWRARDFLTELEKVFTYLDNGRTDGDSVDSIVSDTFVSSAKKYAGEKIHCKYFDVEMKKKGTIHIFFKNEEVLKRFNLFGARGKDWLPPSYGRKPYSDMSKEEREIVDQFEGKESYKDTMYKADFYFQKCSMIMLPSGK